MKKLLLLLALSLFSVICLGDDWNSSPSNWENSPSNWNNSPSNWNNSPSNWDNSPSKYGNDRLMRDESGNVSGYAVPKSDGGVNFYNLNGERKGYLPPR